jgi:multimeric flavodoxin WrbA
VIKILAFNGSPRIGGNTDEMIDQIIAGAKTKAVAVEKVYLNDLKMDGCQAIESCRKTGVCAHVDAFTPCYKKIDEADCLIFATPLYMGRVTGQMKCFIDRLYPYIDENFKSRIKGGKRAVVAMLWAASGDGPGRQEVEYWSKFFGTHVKIVAKLGFPGMTKKGSFNNNKAAVAEAYNAGVALVSET